MHSSVSPVCCSTSLFKLRLWPPSKRTSAIKSGLVCKAVHCGRNFDWIKKWLRWWSAVGGSWGGEWDWLGGWFAMGNLRNFDPWNRSQILLKTVLCWFCEPHSQDLFSSGVGFFRWKPPFWDFWKVHMVSAPLFWTFVAPSQFRWNKFK